MSVEQTIEATKKLATMWELGYISSADYRKSLVIILVQLAEAELEAQEA